MISNAENVNEAVDPTQHHSTKCPKLYGQECTCDGYHTFDELYDHRITLFIALCKRIVRELELRSMYEGILGEYKNPVWRSKCHADGTAFDGWFIMGIHTAPGKQITYHLPLNRWIETDFANTLGCGTEWDGHTADDVLARLKSL